MPETPPPSAQELLAACFQAAKRLRQGNSDAWPELENTLKALEKSLMGSTRQHEKLNQITSQINAGLHLEEVLEAVYREFSEIIPYQRIGLALIEEGMVRAHWVKSDLPAQMLKLGYSAILSGSSLETILRTGQPRIINDLEAYLAAKPASQSTRLIVAEGMRSSLTCPLVANGEPIGFIFFSSIYPHAYANLHSAAFEQIAGQLSISLEKARLLSTLDEQNNAIQRQNDELRRLVDIKNTLLGMAAHDLRGPLGFIQMTAAFLNETAFSVNETERRLLLGDIQRQSAHLLALIEDLLDVSLIEAGKLELKPVRLDLRQLLEDAVNWHARVAGAKGTRVILEAAPPGEITADPLRLRQLLDNLISNAVKYSPPNSTIRISAEHQPDAWLVCVSDQGPGISDADRSRLFQDFARLSARPTGGEKSTGLGLAISRRVVEAHGGRIGVESQPGQGATFWFSIPEAPHA